MGSSTWGEREMLQERGRNESSEEEEREVWGSCAQAVLPLRHIHKQRRPRLRWPGATSGGVGMACYPKAADQAGVVGPQAEGGWPVRG